MLIGVPKEIKQREYRVGMTPAAAREAVAHGHRVLVDVAIDQGGCFETSRPTTHDAPTYIEDGVVHYCVANMPGAVARTSTFALGNATLPFILALAEQGWRRALHRDKFLRTGLNIAAGKVTHQAVAQALGKKFTHPEEALT